MTKDQQIMDYLRSISHGMINLTPAHVQELIEIAKGNRGAIGAFCKLLRWSELKQGWEVQYAVATSDEQIAMRIREALDIPPVVNFYKWECYGSDQLLQGNIFTANTSLF